MTWRSGIEAMWLAGGIGAICRDPLAARFSLLTWLGADAERRTPWLLFSAGPDRHRRPGVQVPARAPGHAHSADRGLLWARRCAVASQIAALIRSGWGRGSGSGYGAHADAHGALLGGIIARAAVARCELKLHVRTFRLGRRGPRSSFERSRARRSLAT